jgi:hypothetical protein
MGETDWDRSKDEFPHKIHLSKTREKLGGRRGLDHPTVSVGCKRESKETSN